MMVKLCLSPAIVASSRCYSSVPFESDRSQWPSFPFVAVSSKNEWWWLVTILSLFFLQPFSFSSQAKSTSSIRWRCGSTNCFRSGCSSFQLVPFKYYSYSYSYSSLCVCVCVSGTPFDAGKKKGQVSKYWVLLRRCRELASATQPAAPSFAKRCFPVFCCGVCFVSGIKAWDSFLVFAPPPPPALAVPPKLLAGLECPPPAIPRFQSSIMPSAEKAGRVLLPSKDWKSEETGGVGKNPKCFLA